jgi:hypothetical protein
MEEIVLFIEKRRKSDADTNYSLRYPTVKALFIVKLTKNGVHNTIKRFLGKTTEF